MCTPNLRKMKQFNYYLSLYHFQYAINPMYPIQSWKTEIANLLGDHVKSSMSLKKGKSSHLSPDPLSDTWQKAWLCLQTSLPLFPSGRCWTFDVFPCFIRCNKVQNKRSRPFIYDPSQGGFQTGFTIFQSRILRKPGRANFTVIVP